MQPEEFLKAKAAEIVAFMKSLHGADPYHIENDISPLLRALDEHYCRHCGEYSDGCGCWCLGDPEL